MFSCTWLKTIVRCRSHPSLLMLGSHEKKKIIMMICLKTHRNHFSNNSSDKSHTSKHVRWWPGVGQMAAVVFGIVIVTFTGVLYIIKQRRKDPTFPSATHRDPLIDRTGHLIQYEETWLSEFLFPSRKPFEEIRDFHLGANDILVVSFPKSGTTWVQEIVSQIRVVTGEAPVRADLNMEDRFPYLEYVYPGLKEIQRQPSPRLIKTHLPYHLLPADVHNGRGKVIYIARNAKDVCISYYHFVRMLSFLHYTGDLNQFFDSFINGTVSSGPWVDHVLRFWQHRQDENILFITYEELHERPTEVIRRVGDFLGHCLTDDQINRVVREASFDTMKHNSLTNYSWWNELGLINKKPQAESRFMRKGEVGDWRNHLTSKMNDDIERICLEPLRNLNLTFTERRPNDDS